MPTAGDEERVEMRRLLENVGQDQVGDNADAVFEGGFHAVGGAQAVEVEELGDVVVAAKDDGAQGTEEIEDAVEEGEDAVLGRHFTLRGRVLFLFLFFFLAVRFCLKLELEQSCEVIFPPPH